MASLHPSSGSARRQPDPRALLACLGVLFAAASTLYATIWMYDARYPSQQVELGFNFSHNQQYSEKTHAIEVGDVVPDSPAEHAGLRVGDRIIGVNGRLLVTSAPFDEAYSRAKPGDKVDLTIARPGYDQSLILHGVFRAAATGKESLAKASTLQITGSYPVLFLLVGFAVPFLRLDDRNAWLLALLFSAFVATPGFNNGLLAVPHGLHPFAIFYRGLLNGLLCPLFYIFFAIFPARSPLDRRLPSLKWISLLFGAFLTLPGFWIGDIRAPGLAAKVVGEPAGHLIRNFFVYGDYV